MLVVVPTHIASYFPYGDFRTLGAVCKSAAPFQSTGGATFRSKTRIKLASRTPKITPSKSTESPTRSLRISASVSGVLNRYSDISNRSYQPSPLMQDRLPQLSPKVGLGSTPSPIS